MSQIDDGSLDEGVSYVGYTFRSLSQYVFLLRRHLGIDHPSHRWLRQHFNYIYHTTQPGLNVGLRYIIYVIIIQRLSMPLQVSLSYAVVYQIVSLKYLSRSSLLRLVGLNCRHFLSFELQAVDVPSTGSHFSHEADDVYGVCHFSDPDVGPSSCMWCWAYLFPFWSVGPHVCSVLFFRERQRYLFHMS